MSLVPHGVRADLPYFRAGALPGERPGALGEAGVVSVVQRELGGCGQLGCCESPKCGCWRKPAPINFVGVSFGPSGTRTLFR